MKEYDLAVVGLGIVGASAVYAAAWAGARVVALDAGTPGGGTSGTSFAWLNSVQKEPEVYHRLNAAGMTAHRELSRELGGDAGYHEGGSLEWTEAGDDERELRERVRRLADRGYPAQWIARERAIALEPALAVPDHLHEVAFFAADAWLDVPRLIDRLLAAAAARGADIRARTACTSMRPRGGRVEALTVDANAIAATSVLVCVGPATQAFLEPLGVAMPVGRVPGLLAVTSRPSEALHRVIHAPGIHLRPAAGGGLLLGAEDIDELATNAGPSAHAALADRLLERAAGVVPAARAVKIVDARMGVRPMPADRHTIAGRIPGFTNAWMIATHSGVTLGPLLGRLLADEIVRGVPSPTLAPFRPDRFATTRAMTG
jgi:glycine/D-amino acid oxidase-like deaminating enzyme